MTAQPTVPTGQRGPLDQTFTAVLQRSSARGGWTFVVTDWTAGFFGTRGLVKSSAPSTGNRFVVRSWRLETAPTSCP